MPPHQAHPPTIRQAIQAKWQALAAFMVHRPQASGQSPIASAERSKLYPYLPAVEEQRDWLERIYRGQ